MARQAVTLKLEGVDDLKETLGTLAPNEAENLHRATVHGIAGVVRDEVGAAAPFKHMRRGFQAVRRRGERGKPASDVRARRSASDWRWFEFGTAERVQKTTGRRAGRITARPFVYPQVEKTRRAMPSIYREQFGKKLEKALARKARKA